MRRRLARWAFAIALCIPATQALAAQDDAREGLSWGATPEAVREVIPGLQDVRSGRTLDAGRVRLRGRQTFAELTFETRYYFGANGLSMISLEGPRRKCTEMIVAVEQRYGQPLRMINEMILLTAIWHSEADDTRIRLTTSPSAGICTLNYEPLHIYREHDLANPGTRERDPRRDPPIS